MGKKLIAISREYGSGGRIIGERLAADLGIPFYDKDIIQMTSEKSGLSPHFIESNEDFVNRSYLFSIATDAFPTLRLNSKYDAPVSDTAFFAQTAVIRDLAAAGSCVIVGRCADFLLRNEPGILRLFFHATVPDRIARIINEYNVPESEAADKLKKVDKNRANFYRHYTGESWGQAKNYDLVINTSYTGINGAVEVVKKALETSD